MWAGELLRLRQYDLHALRSLRRSSRLFLHRSRNVRSSKRAFERGTVPVSQSSGSLIGADDKFHQGFARVICHPHGVIGQVELAKAFVPEGVSRADRSHREAVRRRRGVGIKRRIVDALAAWPKARA